MMRGVMINELRIKYSADKIALLGMLVLSLVLAKLVIISKSSISLSEPIHLGNASLKISLPNSKGWNAEKTFSYNNNSYITNSYLLTGSRIPAAWIKCSYFLTAAQLDPRRRLVEKAEAVKGQHEAVSIYDASQLTMYYTSISHRHNPTMLTYGTGTLADGRIFDIEITCENSTIEQGISPIKILKTIAASIRLDQNPFRTEGSQIIRDIKAQGVDACLKNLDTQSLFLIKDRTHGIIGYSSELIISSRNRPLNIKAAGTLDILSVFRIQKDYSFYSDNSFNNFEFSSFSEDSVSRSKLKVSLVDQKMQISKESSLEPEILNTTADIIPEALLNLVYKQMLTTNTDTIIVDILESDGKVTPALISKIKSDTPETILRMVLLNDTGLTHIITIDTNHNIAKIEFYKKNLIFERTSKDKLFKLFPDSLDKIRSLYSEKQML